MKPEPPSIRPTIQFAFAITVGIVSFFIIKFIVELLT
jgi:hypothetical protein